MRQKVLGTSINVLICNEDLADFSSSIVASVKVFHDGTEASLKDLAVSAHRVHMVLRNIRNEYTALLISSGYSSIAFFKAITEIYECQSNTNIRTVSEKVHKFSTSQILDAKDSIQVMSNAHREGMRKIYISTGL